MFWVILLVVFCFSLFVITHVILFHKRNVRRRFRALITFVFIFSIIYSILVYSTDLFQFHFELPIIWELFVDFLNGVFIYAFFCYFYFHFVVVVDRSVSPRIMVEIEKSPNKKLSFEEIKQSYNLSDKLDYELEDMIMLKMIERKNGFFSNTKRGKRHAFMVRFLRQYLNLVRPKNRAHISYPGVTI